MSKCSLRSLGRIAQRGAEGASFGVREAKKFLRSFDGDKAAGFEEGNAGAEKQGFANIVGDENDGLTEAAGESGEFTLEFGARDGIEGAERLVHEKDGRIGGESAGHADALALATGKLPRMARGKL
jgi:hypothetical protein